MRYLSDRRDRFSEFPPNVLLCALVGETVARRRGAIPYAAAINAVRRLRAAYDGALAEFDALLMPTTPGVAGLLPSPDAPVAEQIRATNDMFANTAAFNATGHPAISLPCGTVGGLPVGMMLVGRHFDESTLFRIAHAYETR
jgi:amidase